MRHPLKYIPETKRGAYFWPLLAATLLIMLVLNGVGSPLINGIAPYGIVSYELAGSIENSSAILDSWDQNAQKLAAFSLGLDFLFLISYSKTIALACIWAADVLMERSALLGALGLLLAWGQWFAAFLDAIENSMLMINLLNASMPLVPATAKWCAVAKFSLVIAGIVYSFLGLAASILSRQSREAR